MEDSEMTMESNDLTERVHALEVAQATQAATQAGTVATLTAAQTGASATTAAAHAGTWATMVAGFAALIVGTFMGLAIAGSQRLHE
jgi:hypothetical protein